MLVRVARSSARHSDSLGRRLCHCALSEWSVDPLFVRVLLMLFTKCERFNCIAKRVDLA